MILLQDFASMFIYNALFLLLLMFLVTPLILTLTQVRQDFVTANSLLPLIPKSEYPAVARFLESQGFKQEALQVCVLSVIL